MSWQYKDLLRFVRTLIGFRRAQVTVRRKQYLTGRVNGHNGWPDVAWFGPHGHEADWESPHLALICLLSAPEVTDAAEETGHDILLLFNSTPDPCEFHFPAVTRNITWRLFIDTANQPPHDIYPDLDGPLAPRSHRVTLTYRSFAAYVAE